METEAASRGESPSPTVAWFDIHAYPSPSGLSIFCHDITEQRAAERAARSTRELLQSSLDAMTAQVAILDGTGKIVAVNAAWQKVAELLAEVGEHYFRWRELRGQCERGRPHQREIASGLRRLIRGELNEFRYAFASDVAKGTWLQLRGARFCVGARVAACRWPAKISPRSRRQRAVCAADWQASQVRRTRPGGASLVNCTTQPPRTCSEPPSASARYCDRSPAERDSQGDAGREPIVNRTEPARIRTVSYLLHPPMLDEAGLPPALRWLCEGFAKRTEITVDLDIAPDIGRSLSTSRPHCFASRRKL